MRDTMRDDLIEIMLAHFKPNPFGGSWVLSPGAAADEIIEKYGLAEEWGVLDGEDSGFVYDGATAREDAEAAYDRYHHESERIRFRIVGPWKDPA